MAAVFAALACQLSKGDRVVASRALFGACYAILAKILPGWGIEVVFVNGGKLDEWEHATFGPISSARSAGMGSCCSFSHTASC